MKVLILFMSNFPNRLVSEEGNGAEHFLAKAKRHNEGTYSSDYTELRDKEKAREFVQWLISQGYDAIIYCWWPCIKCQCLF